MVWTIGFVFYAPPRSDRIAVSRREGRHENTVVEAASGVVRTKKGVAASSSLPVQTSLSDNIVHIVVGALRLYDLSPVCGLISHQND
jgi:hypothetical protein